MEIVLKKKKEMITFKSVIYISFELLYFEIIKIENKKFRVAI